MSIYVRDDFRDTIAMRLAETVLGDPIGFDLAPAVVPGPDGSPVVAYVLILSCKSPLLSRPRISVSDMIADSCPSTAQLHEAVDRSVESLFKVRSQLHQSATS